MTSSIRKQLEIVTNNVQKDSFLSESIWVKPNPSHSVLLDFLSTLGVKVNPLSYNANCKNYVGQFATLTSILSLATIVGGFKPKVLGQLLVTVSINLFSEPLKDLICNGIVPEDTIIKLISPLRKHTFENQDFFIVASWEQDTPYSLVTSSLSKLGLQHYLNFNNNKCNQIIEKSVVVMTLFSTVFASIKDNLGRRDPRDIKDFMDRLVPKDHLSEKLIKFVALTTAHYIPEPLSEYICNTIVPKNEKSLILVKLSYSYLKNSGFIKIAGFDSDKDDIKIPPISNIMDIDSMSNSISLITKNFKDLQNNDELINDLIFYNIYKATASNDFSTQCPLNLSKELTFHEINHYSKDVFFQHMLHNEHAPSSQNLT